MVDISIQNVVKAFEEGNNILDGLSFEVRQGEHVGILGKNGAGKTTLFKLITGEFETDEGEIVIAPGRRIGLISQIPIYPEEYTTDDVLKTAFNRLYKIRDRMHQLEQRMTEEDSSQILKEYDRLSYEFERCGGYDMDTELNRVVNGLEIPQGQRTQLFSTLSGGEKTRVNLARLIIENMDVLLLDEPTNHLDMRAAEWLEEYLVKFKGTVLVISHDRYFLDNVVTRTIEVKNGKAEFYSGNYSFYVVEKERRYQEQLKKYEKEQSEAKRLQEAADRLYQWGTGNKKLMQKSFAIQSRIERLVQTERPDKEKSLHSRFGEKDFYGDEVIVLKGVSKSFESHSLFSDVEMLVKGGERIALIGDNGTGKSTLIKIIMGEERPDSGLVKRGPSVKIAYLPQIIKFNNPHRTLVDTLIYDENCSPQTARNRLGAFKFSGEDVFKHVSDLSGGEQSRLRLCMLMNDDINFLILDEPTNHLDIASREWIEDCVSEYEQTLLFVSHDKYFINKFATRIWEIRDGKIEDFRGNFEQYRIFRASQQKQQEQVKKSVPKAEKNKRKKGIASVEKQLAKLEREIAKLEEQQKEIEAQREEFSADYEKLMELDAVDTELSEELDGLYEQWAELSE